MIRTGLLASAALWLLPALGLAADGSFDLEAGTQRLRFAAGSGLPDYWAACDRPCAEPGARQQLLVGPGAGRMEWVGTVPVTRFRFQPSQDHDTGTVRMGTVRMIIEAQSEVALRITTGPAFIPPQLPGFGAAFSKVQAVRISGDGQELLAEDPTTDAPGLIAATEWAGFRSRFQAWLARPSLPMTNAAAAPGWNERVITWHIPAGTTELEFFAGPMDWQGLKSVDPLLTGLLFTGQWQPLRWLSIGLRRLLELIYSVVPVAGLAIILLSLAVKILLAPLTAVADRWQREVNRIQSRLQPRLAEIRREFRGEEAHHRVLQAYADAGVHPLFTLKSLAGFAIQVPVFIAAYHMLADNYALSGAGFLWIDDLASPDRFAAMGTVPFFGAHLNLLPFLMTALTIVAALVQRDASLAPALLARQRRHLLWMAAGFLLLFYTFPAGMVLYWTANNFWHLVRMLTLDRRRAT